MSCIDTFIPWPAFALWVWQASPAMKTRGRRVPICSARPPRAGTRASPRRDRGGRRLGRPPTCRNLVRPARSILGNDAEAEGAVQEAYVRAYRALDGFRGEARLSTWLTRIAVNGASGPDAH